MDNLSNNPVKNSREGFSDPLIQEYRLIPIDEYSSFNTKSDIDLLNILQTIWKNRKVLVRFLVVGLVIGVLSVLLMPKEYVSSATLMPEYSSDTQGGASSLLKQYGGLIGLNSGTYNSSSNAIRVELYPKIVQSLTFQDKLAKQEFYFPDEDTTATLYEYFMGIRSLSAMDFLTEYTVKLPGKIVKAIKGEDEKRKTQAEDLSSDLRILELSFEEVKVIEELKTRVSAKLDNESGIVSVSVKMRNPKLAAEVAKYTILELTAYLIEYRTEKVTHDLEFIEEQLKKARERFEEARFQLADFEDSNQGTLTARARITKQRLDSEYEVTFNVYNTLTQQFEEAKLKVQEETPIFKVLQPVQVPVRDDKNGVLVLLFWTFFIGITGVCWVFIIKFIKNNQKLRFSEE